MARRRITLKQDSTYLDLQIQTRQVCLFLHPSRQLLILLGVRFCSRVRLPSRQSKFQLSQIAQACRLTELSIVFVHGLRGHNRNTWTKDDVCWPKDLLPKEKALSHTRVLTFGYDANIVNHMGHASLNTLFEHSIGLLNELARERRQEVVSLA